MERKAAAVVALMLAVLALAAMSAVIRPPLTGVASRAITPTPPAVGACGNLRESVLVISDCADPHVVEVAHSWQAGSPAADRPSFGLCRDKVRSYVGLPPAQEAEAHESGRWSFPLRYRPIVVVGPYGSRIEDWSWQVCLVAPLGPAPFDGYRGQVQATPSTGPVSPALRVCYTDPGIAQVIVPCTAPHLGEVVASQPFTASGSAGQVSTSPAAGATESCAAAASSVTGAADPTFGGELRVAVLSDETTRAPFGADIGVYYTADGLKWLVCSLESTSIRTLVGSVAGIGTAPLPFK